MRLENIIQEEAKPGGRLCLLKMAALLIPLISFSACPSKTVDQGNNEATPVKTVIADSFAYPIGEKEQITAAKDSQDDWYDAQDFGENNHLGEDWNKNSGGNTDCGEPVYAAANGTISYAEDAGTGWGNVVIVEHVLPDGKKVQTLYGHLDSIVRKEGTVKKREKIGTVGNADGRYLCHLHFELRDESCLLWNRVFVGYSPVQTGWLDPSDFIDKRMGLD